MARKTKEDAEKTKRDLLAAAQSVFLDKGYSSTSLEDIAALAGLTRGALYWHFKHGKPQILNELCFDRYGKLGEHYQRVLDSDLSPLAKIRDTMRIHLSQLATDREFRDLQFILSFKTELTSEIMGGMEEKVRANRALVKQYKDLIVEGIDVEEIKPDTNPKLAAISMMGLLAGIGDLWLMDRSLFTLEKTYRDVVDIFIDGIKKES